MNKHQAAKWAGSIAFLVAALLIGSNTEFSKYGFFLFLFGHILLTAVFAVEKDTPMVAGNFAFIPIDVYSIYNWVL